MEPELGEMDAYNSGAGVLFPAKDLDPCQDCAISQQERRTTEY